MPPPPSPPAPALAAKPDQIVVFGDSLVDAGNIYLATAGATPSAAAGYYARPLHQRPPNYTDLLSQRLYGTYTTPSIAGGTNYAFGGASIITSNYPVPNLAAQLGFFAAAGKPVDPKALYIINLGANDVFANRQRDGARGRRAGL